MRLRQLVPGTRPDISQYLGCLRKSYIPAVPVEGASLVRYKALCKNSKHSKVARRTTVGRTRANTNKLELRRVILKGFGQLAGSVTADVCRADFDKGKPTLHFM